MRTPHRPDIARIVVVASCSGGEENVVDLAGVDLGSSVMVAYPHIHTALIHRNMLKAGAPVTQFRPGLRMEPGNVYVWDDNYVWSGDMGITEEGNLSHLLDGDPRIESYLGNQLFAAASAVFGNRTISVVLDGRTTDGWEGSKTVKARGGTTYVQDGTSQYSMAWWAKRAKPDHVLMYPELKEHLQDVLYDATPAPAALRSTQDRAA